MRHPSYAPDPDTLRMAPFGAMALALLTLAASPARAAEDLPPAASAGPDVTAPVAAAVRLDGSSSYHPLGLPITFQWMLVPAPDGSVAWLDGDEGPRPVHTTDRVGTCAVDLVVDDRALQGADQVLVSAFHTPPVADAGPDQAVTVADVLEIDARGSYDPDGHEPLTIRMSIVDAPPRSAARLLVIARGFALFQPDQLGEYTVRVLVVDPYGSLSEDRAILTAVDQPPTADAGVDQFAYVGESVVFDGTGSVDPDEHALSWSWWMQEQPENSLALLEGADTPWPTLTPDRVGTYRAVLVVSDGWLDSEPDVVVLRTPTAGQVLSEVRSIARLIPVSAFKPAGEQNLHLRLDGIAHQIPRDPSLAASKTRSLMGHFNGCSAQSGFADKNDWLADCTSQQALYGGLQTLAETLEGS